MTCPICKKPTQAEWRPFCSKRCADLDLGNWLGERYTLPASELEEPETGAGDTEAPHFRLH